ELRARLIRAVAAGSRLIPVAAGSRLIGPVATRRERAAATGAAIAGLPVATSLGTGRAVGTIATIAIGALKTVRAAIGPAAAVETHRQTLRVTIGLTIRALLKSRQR